MRPVLSVLPDFGKISPHLPVNSNFRFRISLLDAGGGGLWNIKGAKTSHLLPSHHLLSNISFRNSKPWGDVCLNFWQQNQFSGGDDNIPEAGLPWALYWNWLLFWTERQNQGLYFESRHLMAFLQDEVIMVNGCR